MQQQSRWPKRFQKLGLIGLLLLAVNAVYQIYYRYIDPPRSEVQRETCDLKKKPCTVRLSDDRQLRFKIQPRDFAIDKKLSFNVRLKNFKSTSVSLTLVPIGHVDNAQNFTMQVSNPNDYIAVAQLDQIDPNQKKWLALVRLHTSDETITFPFKFEVK